jgi:hypothetical protein
MLQQAHIPTRIMALHNVHWADAGMLLLQALCVADVAPGRLLQGHFSAVTSLALSPDGWLLLSGGRDKVVHVWDLRSNSKVTTVPVFEAVEGEHMTRAAVPEPALPCQQACRYLRCDSPCQHMHVQCLAQYRSSRL